MAKAAIVNIKTMAPPLLHRRENYIDHPSPRRGRGRLVFLVLVGILAAMEALSGRQEASSACSLLTYFSSRGIAWHRVASRGIAWHRVASHLPAAFSRSAVNHESGAQTERSSLLTYFSSALVQEKSTPTSVTVYRFFRLILLMIHLHHNAFTWWP